MLKSQLVTVIADASYSTRGETKAAGWASYVASGRGKRYFSAAMRTAPVNSTLAEMQAIVNGIHSGLNSMLIFPGDRLLLQTDCLAAIELLQRVNQSCSPKSKRYAHACEAIRTQKVYTQMLDENDIVEIEFRHVPGHTHVKSPRLHVQDQCDRLAKKAMAIEWTKITGRRYGTEND